MTATDTIAAIATPPGAGALSIVRLSGPRAREISTRLFVLHDDWPPRAVRRVTLRTIGGEAIDDGLAWWAPAPTTFTGEEVVEFTGHGGARVTARSLAAFLEAGCRPAEPGEFTRRAFLHGRLDLAEAEAVADLIAASTDEALRIARAQLAGGLSERIAALRDETLDTLAHVEAAVDFPDEALHPDGNETIAARFARTADACGRLAETFARGRLYREGATVVLAGRPNVGKSSLLNALAGRERAIVTDEPGTTRDVVEEPLEMGGIPVLLSDTAGIRAVAEDGDVGLAEAEGIRRSRAAAAGADLVLFVFDAGAGFGREDARAAEQVAGRPTVVVANKCDLPPAPAGSPLAEGALPVSARTGAGLDRLREAIRARLAGTGATESDGVVITRARHRDALARANGFLSTAADAARRGLSPDLIASDARRGLDALGEITGRVTTDDLLGRVFERFCVGK